MVVFALQVPSHYEEPFGGEGQRTLIAYYCIVFSRKIGQLGFVHNLIEVAPLSLSNT